MIIPHQGHFLISDRGGWRPGAFADEMTALRAEELDDEQIQRLMDAANAREPGGCGGLICEKDIFRIQNPGSRFDDLTRTALH